MSCAWSGRIAAISTSTAQQIVHRKSSLWLLFIVGPPSVILFLATFAGFVTFVFRFFWMRKSMEAELEIERRDKEHQEEINQMKMRFFINISHELRTPLTLILAPLQEVISKINDRWTRNQLEYIQRNANRLLHLVNQLMDYRRAELGVFELKIKKILDSNCLFLKKKVR